MHFSLDEWVDFVHRQIPAATTAAMRDHLETCQRCRQTVEWWRNLSFMGTPEMHPVNATWHVRKEPAKNLTPALVWDSRKQPQRGVRAITGWPWQFLYRAGDYLIDIRMGAEGDNGGQSILVGQVLNSAQKGANLSKIPVVLEWANKSLATSTNAFGEFHVECERGLQGHLSLDLPGSNVVIPIGSQPE